MHTRIIAPSGQKEPLKTAFRHWNAIWRILKWVSSSSREKNTPHWFEPEQLRAFSWSCNTLFKIYINETMPQFQDMLPTPTTNIQMFCKRPDTLKNANLSTLICHCWHQGRGLMTQASFTPWQDCIWLLTFPTYSWYICWMYYSIVFCLFFFNLTFSELNTSAKVSM